MKALSHFHNQSNDFTRLESYLKNLLGNIIDKGIVKDFKGIFPGYIAFMTIPEIPYVFFIPYNI